MAAEAEGQSRQAAGLLADAEREASRIVAKAEEHAEDLSTATREDISTEHQDILRLRAELAADQDALALEREAVEAEKASFAEQREWLEKRKAEIDHGNATISRKADILAEAQEAFITERTLLQRRWAETEKQGLIALERAHEEAERILSEARDHAGEMSALTSASEDTGDVDLASAEEALAMLEQALGETRQEAAQRTSAEEAERGHDNDTGSSGGWDDADDRVASIGSDAKISFGAAPTEGRPDGAVDVPSDETAAR